MSFVYPNFIIYRRTTEVGFVIQSGGLNGGREQNKRCERHRKTGDSERGARLEWSDGMIATPFSLVAV